MDRFYLERLKARLRLSDIISPFVALKPKGREMWGCCPFHQEKTPSFKVNNDRGSFYCFGCHKSGDAIAFLMEKAGRSFQEAVTELADKAGLPPPEPPKEGPKMAAAQTAFDVLKAAATFFYKMLCGPGGRDALDYLAKRGFPKADIPKIVKTFGLGIASPRAGKLVDFLKAKLAPENAKVFQSMLDESGLFTNKSARRTERFWGRLLFPLRDTKGRVIGFGGRTLQNSQIKYLNSPETPLFSKQNYLYGLFEARQNRMLDAQPWVLVEGYLDVIALQNAHMARAVAPLGTATSQQQLAQMLRLTNELFICFDGDKAGQAAALHLAETALPLLKPEHRICFIQLPPEQDPQSLIAAGKRTVFQDALKAALPLHTFILENLGKTHLLTTPEGRSRAYDAAKALFRTIEHRTLTSQYIKLAGEAFLRKGTQKSGYAVRTTAAPPPPNAQLLQEKMILATCLNHPELVHRHAEELAALVFSPLFDTLRHGLLALLAADSLPDNAETLENTLQENGCKNALDALGNTPNLYRYAPFAQRSQPLQTADDGLLDLLKLFNQNESLLEEIRQAGDRLLHTMDAADWDRLKALRAS